MAEGDGVGGGPTYYQRHFGAYRSKPYPMPALVPSYLDREIAEAVDGTLSVSPSKPSNCSLRYGWFTQGFDTRDLKEAKALLDALSS